MGNANINFISAASDHQSLVHKWKKIDYSPNFKNCPRKASIMSHLSLVSLISNIFQQSHHELFFCFLYSIL